MLRTGRRVALLMPEGVARRQVVERLAAADIEVVDGPPRQGAADCLVIDESLAQAGPQRVLEALEPQGFTRQPPVVLFGSQGEALLSRWKGGDGAFALREARTVERLLDHVYFFLHRALPRCRRSSATSCTTCTSRTACSRGKRALIVDDDMRNIFALATVLDEQGMEIVSADNGRDAIRRVESDGGIDIVLMDIMMPEMDGITTMREIRKLERGRDLPIIAVTAKAMKGDREKCIEAGAWDYLSKPVDRLHLLAVLRGWLHR